MQLALADIPAQRPQPVRDPIDVRFARFDAAHPEVFTALRGLALERVQAGAERLGIKALWEEARWCLGLRCGDGLYKLNNDYTAPFARKLMAEEPELEGVFEVRQRRST